MSNLTNIQLAQFIPRLVGQPYWYATCLYPCTQSLLDSKTAQYPDWYTADRMSAFAADIAAHGVGADCIGMVKGFMWTNGGAGVLESIGTGSAIPQDYGGNGCPDYSADGMYDWAVAQGMPNGPIDTLPEVPGTAVRKTGHVGVYIGNGAIIEYRGFDYGCMQTDVDKRDFTEWYRFPFLAYVAGASRYIFLPGRRATKVRIGVIR